MIKNYLNFLLGKSDNQKRENFPPDFEDFHKKIIQEVRSETMTSEERIYSLIESVKYIIKNKIVGDIVECGVWRGGSVMTIIKVLQSLNVTDKKIFLYDTFEGMASPKENDVSIYGDKADLLLEKNKKTEADVIWAYAPLQTVINNIESTSYNKNNIQFVKGKVEETIPKIIPEKISLLRLDTDWYESTKHELNHLYPRLVKGGVLIIDDYGHWKGSKQAVDEYFEENNINPFLARIDYTGRVIIKP